MSRNISDFLCCVERILQVVLILCQWIEQRGDELSDSVMRTSYRIHDQSYGWYSFEFFVDFSRTVRASDFRILWVHNIIISFRNLAVFLQFSDVVLKGRESSTLQSREGRGEGRG